MNGSVGRSVGRSSVFPASWLTFLTCKQSNLLLMSARLGYLCLCALTYTYVGRTYRLSYQSLSAWMLDHTKNRWMNHSRLPDMVLKNTAFSSTFYPLRIILCREKYGKSVCTSTTYGNFFSRHMYVHTTALLRYVCTNRTEWTIETFSISLRSSYMRVSTPSHCYVTSQILTQSLQK